MATPRRDLKIEPLAPHHNRDGFSCGVDSLDRYLRTQASQYVRRKANGVFILVEPEKPETVLGYYTLCPTGLSQGDVSAAARKHVPRYPLVSATLVGRLAVSTARQGEGLGALLLADAVRRAYASASIIGSSMRRRRDQRAGRRLLRGQRVCAAAGVDAAGAAHARHREDDEAIRTHATAR